MCKIVKNDNYLENSPYALRNLVKMIEHSWVN